MANVHIDEVSTEVVITEGIGTWSAEEVRRLVGLVLEQVRREHELTAQRSRDTVIRDRAFGA